MSEEDFEGMEERQIIAREKALAQCNATVNLASKTGSWLWMRRLEQFFDEGLHLYTR